MLVLSRKKNEKIIIGEDITIVVVEIRGDKVHLGIEAPKEVTVHRQEVFDAIHKETEDLASDLPLCVDLQDIMASMQRVKSGEATKQDHQIVALTKDYDIGCGRPEGMDQT